MKILVVLLVCGLQSSTNVTKKSVLGVAGVSAPGTLQRVVKFLQVFELSKVAGPLYLLFW